VVWKKEFHHFSMSACLILIFSTDMSLFDWCGFSFLNRFTADRRRRLAYPLSWYYRHTYMSWYPNRYMIYIRTVWILYIYISTFAMRRWWTVWFFTWQVWLLLSLLNKGALRWGTKKDKPLFNIGLPFLLRYLGFRRETAVTPVFLSWAFKPTWENQCRILLQKKQSNF
jgi:hypothetical protein